MAAASAYFASKHDTAQSQGLLLLSEVLLANDYRTGPITIGGLVMGKIVIAKPLLLWHRHHPGRSTSTTWHKARQITPSTSSSLGVGPQGPAAPWTLPPGALLQSAAPDVFVRTVNSLMALTIPRLRSIKSF